MVSSVPFRPHYGVCWETRENDITVIQVRGDQSRKRAKSINVTKVEVAKTGCILVALEEKPNRKLAQSARSGNSQRTRQFAFECLTTRTVEIHSYVENIKR